MMRIADIAEIIEEWAPRWTAGEQDNIGLQVGDRRRPVRRIGVALEVTPAIVREAVRRRWDMIVTHHPLLFRPPRTLTTDQPVGRMALELAERRIGVYAAHTNLDFAPEGVSVTLAKSLGLRDVRFLSPLRGLMSKLAIFVPLGHEDAVLNALAEAGAGIVGEYSHCSFRSPGTGTFKASGRARPFIGTAGRVESADETKIEAVVPRARGLEAVERVRAVHPYDEMAYDMVPVDSPDVNHGMGAVGVLPRPIQLASFVGSIRRRLKARGVRYAGDPRMFVRRVAVCGGSGSDLLAEAIRSGVDAFVTADVKYHAFHGLPPGFALIDAGHAETEQVILRPLAERLRAAARTRGERLDVVVSRVRTNPVQSS